MSRRVRASALCVLLACGGAGVACRQATEGVLGVRPRSLRDVPADRLAFRFEPDVSADTLPEPLKRDEVEEPLASVKNDFMTRRGNTEALLRTVLDPQGQRALALYGTSQTEKDFRIDLYSVEGQFLRNVLPQDLTGVFPEDVAWSHDGQYIVFSGIRNPNATPTPTPLDLSPPETALPPESDPAATPTPTPTPAPIIASVQTFQTEQVYVADRDGFNLRPLTAREGLIYFRVAWSPDGQMVSALACKEDEYNERLSKGELPAGRPRLVALEGQERLLDDRLTPVAPVWSPDGSKVATAFGYDVAIYDAAGSAATGGALPLAEPLRAASAEYDARARAAAGATANGNATQTTAAAPQATGADIQGEGMLLSLNPIVRLEWLAPETLYAQTAFVHIYKDEPLTFKYMRWHALHLFPQAALLSGNRVPGARHWVPGKDHLLSPGT
jgi:hypothetical protein